MFEDFALLYTQNEVFINSAIVVLIVVLGTVFLFGKRMQKFRKARMTEALVIQPPMPISNQMGLGSKIEEAKNPFPKGVQVERLGVSHQLDQSVKEELVRLASKVDKIDERQNILVRSITPILSKQAQDFLKGNDYTHKKIKYISNKKQNRGKRR